MKKLLLLLFLTGIAFSQATRYYLPIPVLQSNGRPYRGSDVDLYNAGTTTKAYDLTYSGNSPGLYYSSTAITNAAYDVYVNGIKLQGYQSIQVIGSAIDATNAQLATTAATDTTQLKLLSAANDSLSSMRLLKQLSSTNKYGGGWFMEMDSSTLADEYGSAAADKGVILGNAATGKRWVRLNAINQDYLDITWFGAIPRDTSKLAEFRTATLDMISSSNTLDIDLLKIPPDTFYVDTVTVSFLSGKVIEGYGSYLKHWEPVGATGMHQQFKFFAPQNVTIKGITFDGVHSTDTHDIRWNVTADTTGEASGASMSAAKITQNFKLIDCKFFDFHRVEFFSNDTLDTYQGHSYKGTEIRNCVFENTVDSPTFTNTTGYQEALQVLNNRGALITGNKFFGNDSNTIAFDCSGFNHSEFTDNYIENFKTGMYLVGAAGDHNLIANNVIKSNWNQGIKVNGGDNNLVIGNKIYMEAGGNASVTVWGIELEGHNLSVVGNHIEFLSDGATADIGIGIKKLDGNNVLIANNFIDGHNGDQAANNVQYGILIDEETGDTDDDSVHVGLDILSNTLIDCDNAIWFDNTDSLYREIRIADNTFRDMVQGIAVGNNSNIVHLIIQDNVSINLSSQFTNLQLADSVYYTNNIVFDETTMASAFVEAGSVTNSFFQNNKLPDAPTVYAVDDWYKQFNKSVKFGSGGAAIDSMVSGTNNLFIHSGATEYAVPDTTKFKLMSNGNIFLGQANAVFGKDNGSGTRLGNIQFGATTMNFRDGGTDMLAMDLSKNNFGFNTSTFNGTADKTLSIKNGTAPAAATADQIYIWSEDAAAGRATFNVQNEADAGAVLHDVNTAAVAAGAGVATINTGSASAGSNTGWIPIWHPQVGDTVWVPYFLDPTP